MVTEALCSLVGCPLSHRNGQRSSGENQHGREGPRTPRCTEQYLPEPWGSRARGREDRLASGWVPGSCCLTWICMKLPTRGQHQWCQDPGETIITRKLLGSKPLISRIGGPPSPHPKSVVDEFYSNHDEQQKASSILLSQTWGCHVSQVPRAILSLLHATLEELAGQRAGERPSGHTQWDMGLDFVQG